MARLSLFKINKMVVSNGRSHGLLVCLFVSPFLWSVCKEIRDTPRVDWRGGSRHLVWIISTVKCWIIRYQAEIETITHLRQVALVKRGSFFVTQTHSAVENHICNLIRHRKKGSEMLTHKKIRGGWSIGSYIDDIFAKEGKGRKWREMRADVTFLFLRCGNGGMTVVVSGWAARQIRIRSRFQFLVDEQRGGRQGRERQGGDRQGGERQGDETRRTRTNM